MAQVLGALLIFTFIPLLGALPLTGWIVRVFTGKNLRQLGTGNVSVSAAFYHGGTLVGALAVSAEAFKGIFSVLLARYFFGDDTVWPIISLMFIVIGRYWGSQGAGTTNVAWGFFAYDPVVAGLTFLISFVSFTLLRMRDQAKWFVLVLMPVLTALRHPTDGMRILIVACLSGLIAWIYSKIPNDLDLIAANSTGESRRMFRFFQGDRALPTLSQPLEASKVGPKAATLSQLLALGYPVPPGYVLPAGDDPAALIKAVFPNPNLTTVNSAASSTAANLTVGSSQTIDAQGITVVARSSATSEDGLNASAAGQYVSVTEITSPQALERAITVCLNAYNAPSAIRYRQDRNLPDGSMNVLVQPHIFGVYSGVAFSRDPVTHAGDTVIVEALPGEASRVVSGQITPERYQISVDELPEEADWHLPKETTLPVKGQGQVPNRLIQQVAYLARHIEDTFHGIPQDVEWTFDGQQLWVLQSRPVTTLMPIWTRKIAAEVIPGAIRPLTWSINRPLTCGVWGDLFTTVLKRRAEGIDFSQTATLHYARAYFNATLLGDIFTRMGLPPDSLEFLTRGAKFERPPLMTTLQNLPGLLRLSAQENGLPGQFAKADREDFAPALARWRDQPVGELTEPAVVERIEEILALLKQATYYNILAPLSVALRQAILKVDLASLDSSKNPEVRALEEIKQMAAQLRSHLPELGLKSPITSDLQTPNSSASLFAALAEHPEGHVVFDQIDRFLDRYGYLSEVATDIAVPTWRESPQPVRELLTQYLLNPEASQRDTSLARQSSSTQRTQSVKSSWRSKQVQMRLNLKGRVAEVYDRLLATLRSCFVEIESRWLSADRLESQGDLFFLTWSDIRTQIATPLLAAELRLKIHLERVQWESRKEQRVPYLIYGQATNTPVVNTDIAPVSAGVLKGIGASAGQVEGSVHVLESLSGDITNIGTQTILVVPYTDAGWSPLLARIGGLIAEVGGQLSHGAIIAREYGIPAVMNVNDATQKLTTGQRVRIDGQNGTVEIL